MTAVQNEAHLYTCKPHWGRICAGRCAEARNQLFMVSFGSEALSPAFGEVSWSCPGGKDGQSQYPAPGLHCHSLWRSSEPALSKQEMCAGLSSVFVWELRELSTQLVLQEHREDGEPKESEGSNPINCTCRQLIWLRSQLGKCSFQHNPEICPWSFQKPSLPERIETKPVEDSYSILKLWEVAMGLGLDVTH